MKIALDITPLDLKNPHRVRGSGFYLKHLKDALVKCVDKEELIFFSQGEIVPRDVDLFHFPYFEPFFLTLPSKNLTKTIVTVHDLTTIKFTSNFPSGIKGSIKWQLQKRRLKNADAIITDSFSSKKDIKNILNYPEKKIKVIPLAAGELFKPIVQEKITEVKKKYELPEKFVLYVGDVTWNKNLPRLVKAVKKLNIPLILVGKAIASKEFDSKNPWNKDRIEVQNLIHSSEKIKALGFVNDHDLVAMYNAATLFVMPSLYEGFGLPVLEAMSCGTPVVTSGEGSLPEVAGDAAVIVDAYSIEDIAQNIDKVFSDEDLRSKLSEKGLERAQKFTWEKTAHQTLSVYHDIISS